jgi:hypothetical protein
VPERHAVELRLRVRREHAGGCVDAIRERLPDEATVGEPDETGLFEVSLDAGSRGTALELVWNAITRCGADDEVVFALDPNLADHWLMDGDTT